MQTMLNFIIGITLFLISILALLNTMDINNLDIDLNNKLNNLQLQVDSLKIK